MNDSDRTLTIEPYLGAPMTLRLTTGHDRFRPGNTVPCDDDAPVVEFYDRRYANEPGFTPYGEFIRAYCADSLANNADSALLLNTLIPHWSIDPKTMAHVRAWLREATAGG